MEKKVVVMCAEDVAQMRKAHKEAEKAYFQAKVGALEFAVAEMSANAGKEYTLRDLRAMSGLSSGELMAQLDPHRYCKASQEAGIHCKRIRRGYRETTHNFVEVLADGSINPNSTLTIVREEATFQVLPEKVSRN